MPEHLAGWISRIGGIFYQLRDLFTNSEKYFIEKKNFIISPVYEKFGLITLILWIFWTKDTFHQYALSSKEANLHTWRAIIIITEIITAINTTFC